MDIYLSDADFQELLSVLAARGREADATEQARIESLIGRLYLSARPKVSPANTESVKSNGGVKCDMIDGPCSCGAWHTTKSVYKKYPSIRLDPTPRYAAPNGLVIDEDGDYLIYAKAQDGIEFIGYKSSLDDAKQSWAEASITFGQRGVKPEDAKIFRKTRNGYKRVTNA